MFIDNRVILNSYRLILLLQTRLQAALNIRIFLFRLLQFFLAVDLFD